MWIKFKKLAEADEGGDLPGSVAPQPNEAVQESEEDHGIDWGDITASGDDEVADGPAEEPREPAVTEQPVALADAPAQESQEEAALATEVPQPPQEAQQPQFTPEQIAAAEQAYMQQLASFYTFNEDDAVRVQTEPEKVLPQLAARLHMDVMKNVMAQMQAAVPQMIQQMQAVNTREQSAQELFYKAWPELKGFDQQVLQVGRMFRQMNPNASPDEAVKRIGEIALATLGMQRQQAQAQQQQPQQQAFRPSVPGRVSSPAPAQDFWGNMAEEEEY
jgi:hypothetical protein